MYEQQQKNVTKLIDESLGDIQQKLNSFLLGNNTDALHVSLSAQGYFEKAQVLHLMPTICPAWLSYLANVITELCQYSKLSLDNRAYKSHLSIYCKAKKPLMLPSPLLLNM